MHIVIVNRKIAQTCGHTARSRKTSPRPQRENAIIDTLNDVERKEAQNVTIKKCARSRQSELGKTANLVQRLFCSADLSSLRASALLRLLYLESFHLDEFPIRDRRSSEKV